MISKELQIGRAGEFLVLCDLLLNGKQAFSTDQGVSYDICFEHNNKIIRLQVKTTRGPLPIHPSYKSNVYRFCVRRSGKLGNRMYSIGEFDGFALVTLDNRSVHYLKFTKEINKTMILRTKKEKYTLHGKNSAPYIEDLTLERFLNEMP